MGSVRLARPNSSTVSWTLTTRASKMHTEARTFAHLLQLDVDSLTPLLQDVPRLCWQSIEANYHLQHGQCRCQLQEGGNVVRCRKRYTDVRVLNAGRMSVFPYSDIGEVITYTLESSQQFCICCMRSKYIPTASLPRVS